MTSVIEISVPASQFALGDTLSSVPNAKIEVMRNVTTGPDAVMPIVVFEGADEEIEPALRADTSVSNMASLAALEKESVYRIEWEDRTEELFHRMFGDHGTVLRARAEDGEWGFRVLCSERESMEHCYDHCRETGIRFQVESIYDPTIAVRPTQYGLSEKQYETLTTALQRGFYEIPSEVTLEELAEEFDVSHQALSERLSRAHKVMITNVVSDDFPVAEVV